jgi:hypothetical protein
MSSSGMGLSVTCGLRFRAVSDPEGDQHQPANPDQEGDEALGHRAEPAEAETTPVNRMLDRPSHCVSHLSDEELHLLSRSWDGPCWAFGMVISHDYAL